MECLPVILTHGGRLHRAGKIVVCFERMVIARGGRFVGFAACSCGRTQTKAATLQFAIAVALLMTWPRRMNCAALVEAVYGDDIEGGPVSASANIKTSICAGLRPRLRHLGLRVSSMGWRGYLLAEAADA